MSLLIYSASDGASFQADPRTFGSIAELRAWIEDKTKLPTSHQILLTARGTNLKEQYLVNEKEVFVYNKKAIDPNYKPVQAPLPPLSKIQSPPGNLESHNDHSSWINLFHKRLQWSESVLSRGRMIHGIIEETDNSIKNMQRAIAVAFTMHDTHIVGTQQRLKEKQQDADNLLRGQEEVFTSWEQNVRMAAQIPAHPSFAPLVRRTNLSNRAQLSVADLINLGELKGAAAAAELKAQEFVGKMNELRLKVEGITNDTASLQDEIQETSGSTSNYLSDEPNVILEELEIVAQKIRTDYDRVLEAQSLGQISKWALQHTKDYLPGLNNSFIELNRLYQQAVRQKNIVAASCTRHFQYISKLQSRISQTVLPLFDETLLESDSFNALSRAYRLPFLYGALLIECVRRKEWSEKVIGDSRRLAEDLAAIREDEEKRRKKWHKQIGSTLPFVVGSENRMLNLEINLRDGDEGWPDLTRQDIENFITSCKGVEGTGELTKEISQLYQDLDKPLRKLAKRIKGFKSGSVHEAAMMSNSSLITDEARDLQAKNVRLEEKCRNAESRIRRLEDLLHRGFGRPNTANVNPYQNYTPSSPLAQSPITSGTALGPPSGLNGTIGNSGSRPSTMASRRLSSAEQSEKEKSLAARIEALEAELSKEKETTAKLQKETAERLEVEKDMNERITEADHTKRDLLSNLEAQQQEFLIERKALEQHIEDLKMKLDEADEELDRLEAIKSMEIEKKGELEGKISILETELEKANNILENLRSGTEEESEKWEKKHRDELESLRQEKDAVIHQLSVDLRNSKARVANLENQVKIREDSNSRHLDTNRKLQNSLKELEDTLAVARQSVAQRDSSLFSIAQETYSHLSQDPPPSDLRYLLSSTETLVEKTVAHNQELNYKLERHLNELSEQKAALNSLQSRFDSRTIRAKDLTQRLYTHNVRCTQLLESLGFSVIRRENSLQIVRVPKTASSTVLTKGTTGTGGPQGTLESIILHRTLSNPPSTTTSPQKPSQLLTNEASLSSSLNDINLLYWMEADDSDVESSKYAQYLTSIGMFDLDAFSDSITKRVKEAEHMARKYQKEARAYREKAHRYHAEASDKIAYKSFKEGDLALFLPTRNQVNRPWAAFNIGAPHYFLKEVESHRLRNRDWLLARIGKVEERVVDLSKSTSSLRANPSIAASSNDGHNTPLNTAIIDDENPFELSDGLRWYLLDATEEKPGAPSTPGLSASTVSSSKVDVKGSLKSRKPVTGARKTLTHLQEGETRRRGSNGSMSRASVNITPEEVAAALAGGGGAAVTSRAPTPALGAGASGFSPTPSGNSGSAGGVRVSAGGTAAEESGTGMGTGATTAGGDGVNGRVVSSARTGTGVGEAEKIADLAAAFKRAWTGVGG